MGLRGIHVVLVFAFALVLVFVANRSDVDPVPKLPEKLNISMSGTSMQLPLTGDLHVAIPGQRGSLSFLYKDFREQSALYIARHANRNIEADWINYNFGLRQSNCDSSSWMYKFCATPKETTNILNLYQIVVSCCASAATPDEMREGMDDLAQIGRGIVFEGNYGFFSFNLDDGSEALVFCSVEVNGRRICTFFLFAIGLLSSSFKYYIARENVQYDYLLELSVQSREILFSFLPSRTM